MSSEDSPRTGSSDLEDTLVAALGFEPTAGVAVDSSNVLVDDGTGDALDWSGSEGGSRPGNSHVEVHDPPSGSDGAGTGPAPPTAKADPTMNPPKGKGKGPRTFRKSEPRTPAGTESNGNGSDASTDAPSSDAVSADAVSPDAVSPDAVSPDAVSPDAVSPSVVSPESAAAVASSGVDATVRLTTETPDAPLTDVDPADLVDGDSSGVKPVDLDDCAVESPAVDNPASDAGASTDPSSSNGASPEASGDSGIPPLGDLLDGTGPLPAGLIGVASPSSPPSPSDTGAAPATVAPSVGAGQMAAAATIITETPSGPPPPSGDTPPTGESVPVLNPPPPVIGDPTPGLQPESPTGEKAANTATTGAVVKAPKTDLAARLPQLLDQGFLKRTRRVRSRKVRRVVRHIDPWSVLTFSVLFFLCLFAALLLASVLVWNAAVAAGTIENIESFIREIGDYQTYEIKGDVVFRAAMVIMGILTLAASVMMVLLVVVFNLISDLVGGIRITVIEEETVRVRRRQNQ